MFAGATHPPAPGGHPAAADGSPAAAGPSRAVRATAAGLAALAVMSDAAWAQAQSHAPAASGTLVLPPLKVQGRAPSVRIGGEPPRAGAAGAPCPVPDATSSSACAAQALQAAAHASAQAGQAGAESQARQDGAPLAPSVRSPDVAVGVVNTTALAEQFGANVGKSVHPYRPAPPPQAPSSFTRRP